MSLCATLATLCTKKVNKNPSNVSLTVIDACDELTEIVLDFLNIKRFVVLGHVFGLVPVPPELLRAEGAVPDVVHYYVELSGPFVVDDLVDGYDVLLFLGMS